MGPPNAEGGGVEELGGRAREGVAINERGEADQARMDEEVGPPPFQRDPGREQKGLRERKQQENRNGRHTPQPSWSPLFFSSVSPTHYWDAPTTIPKCCSPKRSWEVGNEGKLSLPTEAWRFRGFRVLNPLTRRVEGRR